MIFMQKVDYQAWSTTWRKSQISKLGQIVQVTEGNTSDKKAASKFKLDLD